MKRSLISFDGFKKIQNESLSSAERELLESEDILAKTLGVDDLKLFCFGESDVTYQTLNGTFVHANYGINRNQIVLENIQELVIEEDSEKNTAKETIANMVEALLENNELKASQLFDDYLHLPALRRQFTESFKATCPTGRRAIKKQNPGLVAESIRSRKKAFGAGPKSKNPRWRNYARKMKPGKVNEWAQLCENVADFIDYKELGPSLKTAAVKHDPNGNVVAVAVPTISQRNENKILTFNWKTLDHEVKVLRSGAKKIHEDANFCKAMADLKRYNAVSDDNALETTIENIVSHWPSLIYLTQAELAKSIATALETANVAKYDDKMCNFMAEGLLRKAHHAFSDRVKKITNIAGHEMPAADVEDAYSEFKNVIDQFYPTVDESNDVELNVFKDLYRACHEVYNIANDSNDEVTKQDMAMYLSEMEDILNQQSEPNMKLAESVVDYLFSLVENNLMGGEWNVSNTPHMTISGDHPDMAKKAAQSYSPSADGSYDWGDVAPVSDGKSYKGGLADEMRSSSWGNIGGEDTYPSLKNPYVPKPFGTYTMKGEMGADKDGESDWSRYQDGDTWPNLQNPYVPKSVRPPMKSDNLVQDK